MGAGTQLGLGLLSPDQVFALCQAVGWGVFSDMSQAGDTATESQKAGLDGDLGS